MGVKGHLWETSFELMQKLIRSPICESKINQFSGHAYPWGVAGAAARVGTSKHLDPLPQRTYALLQCQGETN